MAIINNKNYKLSLGSSAASQIIVFKFKVSKKGKFNSLGCPDLYKFSSTKPKFYYIK
jgi:hypothetical protein